MLDLSNSPFDLSARVIHVIVPANGHRLNMRDFADDHFCCRHEFVSELTMCHRQGTDHSTSRQPGILSMMRNLPRENGPTLATLATTVAVMLSDRDRDVEFEWTRFAV